jgi:protein-S-isoprenylcysteine O-methyltransferase Ste14
MGPWWLFIPTADQPRLPLWVCAVAVLLGMAGALLVIKSVRTLGREWSLTARVIQGHRLVTSGPYAIVRNPIYTGMWGLQLATAIAFSSLLWWGLLPIATAIYYAGTLIRVRGEEKLLRQEFGGEFEEYARCVPAIVPWRLGVSERKSSAEATQRKRQN